MSPPDADHHTADDQPSDEACTIELRPRNWSRIAAASRWSASDPPLYLTVLAPGTTLDQALEDAGFENDEDGGRGYGIAGGYGSWAVAQPYRLGRWRGKEADIFFRGFAREGAQLEEGESHVFSGEIGHIVVRSDDRRVLQFTCEGGTPDEHVDCDPAIASVLRTVSFFARKR